MLSRELVFDTPVWFRAVLLLPLLSLGFGAVLLSLVLRRDEPAGWLGSRTLFFFSKISYSLYLVHQMFDKNLFQRLQDQAWFTTLPASGQLLVFLPIFLTISLLASLLLHYVVEKPFLLLKDRPKALKENPSVSLTSLGQKA